MKEIKKYEELKILAHPIRWKIFNLLKEKESYLNEIAKHLNISPESAHYHLKILKPYLNIRKEKTQSNFHRIYYSLKHTTLSIGKEPSSNQIHHHFFTSQLIRIIVGSPDPHGRYQVRARDSYLSAYISHYLGKRNYEIEVIWDTEAKSLELYKNDIVVLGGPLSNVIAEMINTHTLIRFDEKSGYRTFLHGKKRIPAEDNMGLVYCSINPLHHSSKLIWLAGSTLQGTFAAVLAYVKQHIKCPGAYLVEGLDKNSDGKIDTITTYLSLTV
ncbi:MAG: helix-turn-helix domain-containing protein [Candidatus Nanohaloarchaeota archaeon]|nr:helix-turn-helix domain-containing protein [Candidatus Nanohaloarchaeota archaeon]